MTASDQPGEPGEREMMGCDCYYCGGYAEGKEGIPGFSVGVINGCTINSWAFQEVQYQAAMQRLRVAVEALRTLNHPDSVCKFVAGNALAAIGELPD